MLAQPAFAKDVELLNVSYDPTRELYEDYNKAFAAYWLKKTGDKVITSSSRMAARASRRVPSSTASQADVVTLALGADIEEHRGRPAS